MSDPVDGLLGFLGPRAVPGVELVELSARTYARVLHGRVEVVRAGDWAAADDPEPSLAQALLGRRAEVDAAEAHLRDHPIVGPLVRRSPGLRVPGHPDGAELAIRAVLGQQVSVAAARTLAARLSAEHGVPLAGASSDGAPSSATPTDPSRPSATSAMPDLVELRHGFAAPSALARVDPESLPMPRARGRALVGLAVALAAGDVDLSPGADVATARAQLLALRGIGPWTADYVVMRAQRAPDVLLVGDLGVLHALRDLGADTSKPALKRLAEEVSPFGSFATLHLWNALAS